VWAKKILAQKQFEPQSHEGHEDFSLCFCTLVFYLSGAFQYFGNFGFGVLHPTIQSKL